MLCENIENVSEKDSGQYRCDTDLSGEASVEIRVVRDKTLVTTFEAMESLEKTESVIAKNPQESSKGSQVLCIPKVIYYVLFWIWWHVYL